MAGDLPCLAGIERAAGELFRAIGMDDIADDEPPALSVYEHAQEAGLLWVAAGDGKVVGYVMALQLDGQAHLEQLSVAPAHGRRGLGAALVSAVVAWASALGAPAVTLSTFRDVPWNGPYYERLGFEVVDETAWTPALQAVRAHEAAEGLDVSGRVIMRRRLPSEP